MNLIETLKTIPITYVPQPARPAFVRLVVKATDTASQVETAQVFDWLEKVCEVYKDNYVALKKILADYKFALAQETNDGFNTIDETDVDEEKQKSVKETGTMTYLWNTKTHRIIVVQNITHWRPSSARMHGFDFGSTITLLTRPMTASEQAEYEEQFRLKSWNYEKLSLFMTDEKSAGVDQNMPNYKKVLEYAQKLKTDEVEFSKGGIIESEAFKKWFDGSKVVDEKGNPLVVYHGTANKWETNQFQIQDKPANEVYGGNGEPTVGPTDNRLGFFFTNVKLMAEWFAGIKYFSYEKEKYVVARGSRHNPNARIIPCFLCIKNPYVIDETHEEFNEDEDSVQIYFGELRKAVTAEKFREQLISKGHDGIILRKNNTNYYEDGTYDIYCAFYNTQIKLADGTNTTFDSNNPDITMAKGGSVTISTTYEEIIHSENFKHWFGDWEAVYRLQQEDPAIDAVSVANLMKDVSKVVDATGKPLIVYHGHLNNRFKYFRSLPAFFSESKNFAYDYADTKSMDRGLDADINVMPCFLNLKRMFDPAAPENIEYARKHLPATIKIHHGTFWFLDADIPKDTLLEQMQGIVTILPDQLTEQIKEKEVGDILYEKVSMTQSERVQLVYKDDDFGWTVREGNLEEAAMKDIADYVLHEREEPGTFTIKLNGKYYHNRKWNYETTKYEKNTDPVYLQFEKDVADRIKYLLENIYSLSVPPSDKDEDYRYYYYKKSEADKFNNHILLSRHNLRTYKTKTYDNWTLFENETVQKFLVEHKFDGWCALERGKKTYGVFDARNIKLADGTNTTFGKTDDIRYENGGSLSELDGTSALFVKMMIKRKLARIILNKSKPIFNKQLEGIQDAVKKGFLYVKSNHPADDSVFVRPTQKLLDMYFAKEKSMNFEDGGSIRNFGKKWEVSDADDMSVMTQLFFANLQEGDSFNLGTAQKPRIVTVTKVVPEQYIKLLINGVNKKVEFKYGQFAGSFKSMKPDWFDNLYRDVEGMLIVDSINRNNPLHEFSKFWLIAHRDAVYQQRPIVNQNEETAPETLSKNTQHVEQNPKQEIESKIRSALLKTKKPDFLQHINYYTDMLFKATESTTVTTLNGERLKTSEIVAPGNDSWRKIWSSVTGVALPSTKFETEQAVEKYFAEKHGQKARQQPRQKVGQPLGQHTGQDVFINHKYNKSSIAEILKNLPAAQPVKASWNFGFPSPTSSWTTGELSRIPGDFFELLKSGEVKEKFLNYELVEKIKASQVTFTAPIAEVIISNTLKKSSNPKGGYKMFRSLAPVGKSEYIISFSDGEEYSSTTAESMEEAKTEAWKWWEKRNKRKNEHRFEEKLKVLLQLLQQIKPIEKPENALVSKAVKKFGIN